MCRKLEMIGSALLRDSGSGQWLFFGFPLTELVANRDEDVVPVLEEVERATKRGRCAVGFLAYEAACALDSALRTRKAGAGPLAWFGLYAEPRTVHLPPIGETSLRTLRDWTPDVTWQEYQGAVRRIHKYIAAGETYQVNYTFRLTSEISRPLRFFLQLVRAQRPRYGAWLRRSADVICSVSPELFFALEDDRIRCCPMKGTRKRGRTSAEDVALCAELKNSGKDRAENLMIVDMIRNDLGRVARPGSVKVNSLFDVERLPTLWQMTSTVEACTRAPLTEIFRALFPCASVTGAPKVRTMEIIAELEKSPRGIYTGAIGYIMPGRRAQFNVAIRTAHVCEEKATYGVGGGVVWDSSPKLEYEEALAKGAILMQDPRPFSLLETIRWDPQAGFFFLDRHLQRLGESAGYFGYSLDLNAIRYALENAVRSATGAARRLRMICNEDGRVEIETSLLEAPFAGTPESATETKRVCLAVKPVSSEDVFLYHKTTRRNVYDQARREARGADDVLLWNERGEVTESCVANLVAVFGGEWLTPARNCGLLNGVYRASLLESGRVREAVLTREDVCRADSLYLINSVRGWMRCHLE